MFKDLKTTNFIISLIIFGLLEYAYIEFVSVYFGYKGFSFEFDFWKNVIGKILFIAITLFVHFKKMDSFTYAMINIFMVLSVWPNIIVYEYATDLIILPLLNILLIVTIYFFSKFDLRFKTVRFDTSSSTSIFVLLTILFIVPFLITYGVSFKWKVLALQDIYEVRDEAAESANVITRYLYSMIAKVFFPAIMLYGWLKKRKILMWVGVFAILYLYLVSPHKSVLFSLFVIFGFVLGKNYIHKTTLWLVVVVTVLILGRVLTEFFDFHLMESLFARRTFFVKAILNIGYFEVFEGQPIYLSNSILSPFFEYPHSLPPPNLVASEFLNDPEIHSNNGFFSTGYMNFGMWGVLGNILFISIIISLIRSMKLHPAFYGILFIVFKAFLSSSIFTTFLSHGFIMFVALSMFFLSYTAHINRKSRILNLRIG